MNSGAILIVPACERGRGGGHLVRSLSLLRKLKEAGREVFLWIPEYPEDDLSKRFRTFVESSDEGSFLSDERELESRSWALIVLDRFRTSREEFAAWVSFPGRGNAPLVGIDEGGPCRSRFDFLIDLLPSVERHKPNISAPGLLPLPKKRRPPPVENSSADGEKPLRILISFGAEDSAGLGPSAARALSLVIAENAAAGAASAPELTLITTDPSRQQIEGVRVIGMIPNLAEHLAEYDLLITHFGLGAFEAVYARVPVLPLSPGFYHDKLCRHTGFWSLGVGKRGFLRKRIYQLVCFSKGDFVNFIGHRGGEIARRFGLEEDQKEDLASFIGGLEPHAGPSCPVCEEAPRMAPPVLARFKWESYRQCPHCGVIYLGRLKDPPIEYEKDYFFDFYKKQYGKTYLEDFANLKEMGLRRLENIVSLMRHFPPEKSPACETSLLDIGCAYGPFLAAAAESGFSPSGIEPAGDAVEYVKNELGFPCRQGFFPDALPPDDSVRFDVVTLWYVIEHFKEPGKMIREIHRLLKPGGVLAFSTPSFTGISGRKFLAAFLDKSPPDHWTIWSPAVCKRTLRQYGFRLCKIVVTGHHPERFPFLGPFASANREGSIYRLLLFVSRLFRLGDTFEAYCVRE